ncbi:LysR family transcriptional regulator [Enterocloster clostridioformis]|uniref:LysR family transcriptional regulator n=1 Tax=Enterocloster clostridioformis TaxID=1531 RepID=UPI00080C47D6|nr:LysR family transcriptional regulator [Enterocloster clostridioformis]QQQ99596.1 LysR family transcriptional regulator [Enterocloster clostridioformis]
MDISYFKDFVVLAETQNYWSASERLFIGQSSLSKHIMTLEKQLGAPLFSRTSRKVELTEFGQLMLPYAQSITELRREYETAAFNYQHHGSEKLTIASIPAMAQYKITDLLIQLQQEYPSIQVSTIEDDTLVIREWLIKRTCDLAFLRDSADYLEHDPDKELQLAKIPYASDRLVAVFPKEHPLASLRQVELAQLSNESFALIREGTVPYKVCMRACKEAGFTPEVLFTSHNLDGVLDMVTKGNCIALLFSNHVAYPLDSVLSIAPPFAVVPVVPEIQTNIYLAYLKGRRLPAAATRFAEYVTHSKSINSI